MEANVSVIADVQNRVLKSDFNARRSQLDRENEDRVKEITRARLYYSGDQYVVDNDEAQAVFGTVRLPQHLKLLAYSTQIQECVDYIAAQLAGGFQVTGADAAVHEIVTGTLSNSPDLASDDDADSINVVSSIRDALIASDVAVRVRWDAENSLPWLEFWESEAVDFHFAADNRFKLERVVLSETVWAEIEDAQIEVQQRQEWYLDDTGACLIDTYQDGTLTDTEPTDLSFIPWRMWRAQRKSVRRSRGESVVSPRVQGLADRYDANEQLSFAIARYNSHGNLAVIGDAALLTSTSDARIRKDVADVLTFPGGTALQVITLPTDPGMIEHQRQVLLDALFSAFGVTRLDSTTVQGLGALSGYSLEILNRKTEGTFEQIRMQLSRDIRSTLNLALDIHAQMSGRGKEPDAMFSNREIKIVMGSGYVVDDVMLRDDYTAKLVSRSYVLKERGLTEPQITEIEKELASESPEQPEVGLSKQTVAEVGSVIKAGSILSNVTPGPFMAPDA